MTRTYTTRDCDLGPVAETVKALWIANLAGHSAQSAEAKLELGYLSNPAGQGAAVLLFADDDGKCKGVQGLHPRRFHFGERTLAAAGLADYAVDAAHRSLGPALMLMRRGVHLAGERFDLTYGLPNAKAAPVCARAGLIRLGLMGRYAKPLATFARLVQRVPRVLAICLAPVADMALAFTDTVRRHRETHRLACRDADWDDPAIDALWASRDRTLLLSERSSAMLRWRFGESSRGAWRVSIAADAAGRPTGYVVWRLVAGFAEVGDFHTSAPSSLTAPLFHAFTQIARREGAASISVMYFGGGGVDRQLRRAGLQPRPGAAPVFKARGAAELDAPGTWYLTAFDNDAD